MLEDAVMSYVSWVSLFSSSGVTGTCQTYKCWGAVIK